MGRQHRRQDDGRKTIVIRVSRDVSTWIDRQRQGRETPNDVLRRKLGLPATPAGARRATESSR